MKQNIIFIIKLKYLKLKSVPLKWLAQAWEAVAENGAR